ncbi:alpha/beta fold hydrolase [Kitasatospora sp. MAP5-34]|uniref:alpha/beta hydrolase family protein n=1 Tax=Kitasatospora sp. MAP5-34 TaxID=3035102 RepID=UPI002474E447|nr:alpha/beta fold hydrolase [Kitasatospora sp. MAP5-34]MDH6578456.1 pimeloyl-ACP methyl ester carboxylesterase [Kitasatospora sp. MAP5-34]
MRWGTAAIVAAATVGTGVAVLLLGRKVSERVVHLEGAEPAATVALRVHALGAGRVTLSRTPETARPGRYALEWGRDGHAVIGEILRTDVQTVTRRLERADSGTLDVGTEVRLTPRVYLGNPESALGLEYIETASDGELGSLPAWYTAGVRGTWVVLVHGPGADRSQALPVLPVLKSLLLPTLTVTYRGDEGAPASPDGLGHFGETEWRDIEAAIRLALTSGAGKVILYGWSLGATVALQAAARSDWRESVAGLVLDSPVLDWPATVRQEVVRSGVPAPLAGLGALAAQGRAKVDLASFARLADGADLHAPTLLLHSPADDFAPYAAAERLAHLREDVVSLHPVAGADHAALWNADPAGYTETLRRWLTPLL